MDNLSVWQKAQRIARLSFGQLETDLRSVLSVPKAIFTAFFYFFSLWFGFSLLGIESMIDAVPHLSVQIGAGIMAAFCLLILTVISAPYRAWVNEKKIGKWVGRKFVFHSPQHAFTTQWTVSKNGTSEIFKFKHAEPRSFVSYRIDVDGGGARTVTSLGFRIWDMPIFNSNGEKVRSLGRTGATKTNSRCELTLHADSLPDSDPVVIRVYVLSFEVD